MHFDFKPHDLFMLSIIMVGRSIDQTIDRFGYAVQMFILIDSLLHELNGAHRVCHIEVDRN